MPYKINPLTGKLNMVLPAATAATDSSAGVVELATDAETITGASDSVVTTPGNITARLAAPGEIGGTTPAAGHFTTLSTTGNITPASGYGIDFSGTSDATGMASELLDDYEEGTWTPTVGDGTNNYSLTTVVANYTKIGNVVHAVANIAWDSIGSVGSTQLRITLPFLTSSTSNYRVSGAIGACSGIDTQNKQVVLTVLNNTSVVYFYLLNDNANAGTVAANAQDSTGTIRFQITYHTS